MLLTYGEKFLSLDTLDCYYLLTFEFAQQTLKMVQNLNSKTGKSDTKMIQFQPGYAVMTSCEKLTFSSSLNV